CRTSADYTGNICSRCSRYQGACSRYPPGTKKSNNDNGLRWIFELVPGVPGKFEQGGEGKRGSRTDMAGILSLADGLIRRFWVGAAGPFWGGLVRVIRAAGSDCSARFPGGGLS